jgi:hypothetical protein
MNPARPSSRRRRRQEGAATLVVVMVLFFIVSLVAAYTSRNMIFEQKTSANQYRSTQALAAAEAGVEWALVMLNGGRVNDDCAFDAAAPRSFRERYLDFSLDPATALETGFIELNLDHTGNLPTCVMEGAVLTCKCPFDADLDPSPIGTGPQPAFRVRLSTNDQPVNNIVPALPGVIRIQARGCTRLDLSVDGCLDWADGNAAVGDGQAEVTILAALRSGLVTPPAAPLTARGAIAVAAAPPVAVVNQDTGTAGITVQTGAPAPPAPATIVPTSLPGTPGEFSVIGGDASLGSIATGDRMFAAFFGMRRELYRQQPGVLACANPCNAAAVTALMNADATRTAHPNHMIWVEGDLTVDGDMGSAAVPVLLVVTGDVRVTADAAITGLVYLAKADAELDRGTFTTTLSGAVVAEEALDIVGTGNLTLTYDAVALNRLRTTYGSYVRVPGTWRDWN